MKLTIETPISEICGGRDFRPGDRVTLHDQHRRDVIELVYRLDGSLVLRVLELDVDGQTVRMPSLDNITKRWRR